MKNQICMVHIIIVLFLFPVILTAKNEDSDWKKAQNKNSVASYDNYQRSYPNGVHTKEAKDKAAKLSAQNLSGAVGLCDPDFARMYYFAVGDQTHPLIGKNQLSSTLEAASSCNVARSGKKEDRSWAVDGLLVTRRKMETLLKQGVGMRSMINLDLVLLPYEESVINDTFESIVLCSNQSSWTDTDPKKVFQCAKPYRDVQLKMASSMAAQIKYDFAHVSEVPDPEFRITYWKKVNKMCKWQIMEELSRGYQLYNDAENARKMEKDPKVKNKIEDVSIRMAGGGKPTRGTRY